jgi:hypothetical protein
MEKVRIKVSDFYGVPSLYDAIPPRMFYALDLAVARGEQFAEVFRCDLLAAEKGAAR